LSADNGDAEGDDNHGSSDASTLGEEDAEDFQNEMDHLMIKLMKLTKGEQIYTSNK